ncbi:SEC23-interacting protein-like, partial [Saccoglossus kowalevskii]|uniref:SEC23-interacting protein-like n=1 Tax=Saccoglossus kowalevskii TaxID=10224 RepID=A0ABM0ML84_SACKO
MAEKGQPPLLLFPPSEGLAPQLVPVPATASLFPTEDGEADSFLGQSDTPPTDLQQPQQGMTFPFLQQQPSPQPDPFTQQVPSMQPPPVDQPLPPPQTQYYSPQQFASPPPPPTGEHQQDQSLFGSRRPQRVFAQTQPTISQSTGSLPPTAPPPTTGFSQKPMFDPSKPPPTSTDFQQMRSPAMAESQGAVASGSPQVYTPVQGHWFYSKLIEQRSVWLPFTMADALKLEDALATVQQDPDDCIIQTDGGRYDVDLRARLRSPVYWEEESTEVRRCTWFYKGDGDNRFIPYEEAFAEKLEQEFQFAVTNNVWHRRLEFPDGETVVMHNPNVIVHFRPSTQADEWGAATQDSSMRPRVVKRGMDDDVGQVEEGEPNLIDHVMFVVHGIGPVCDLRFRSIVECVDDFRSVSLSLLQSHFGHHQDEGKVGRVEFLPVSWHSVLHGDATGVDRRLRNITLPSIGRLRHFTNDTLLDILFYSSPLYCQTVSDRVGGEINRLYQLFRERNPAFCGKMSIIGHSLGSLICFDLLSHQHDPNAPVHLPEESPPQVQTTRSMPDLEADSVDALDVSVKPEPLPSLEDSLKQLGLSDFIDAFKKEQIDMETL